MKQQALIPQLRVLATEAVEAAGGVGMEVRYSVLSHDPDSKGKFEAWLPRAEVKAELLAEYEKGTLPRRTDSKNTKAKVPWTKCPLQKRRWLAKWPQWAAADCKTAALKKTEFKDWAE
jgi:hypothetical protein